ENGIRFPRPCALSALYSRLGYSLNPHPRPLSLGERGEVRVDARLAVLVPADVNATGGVGGLPWRTRYKPGLPLPLGEGRGEGKRRSGCFAHSMQSRG